MKGINMKPYRRQSLPFAFLVAAIAAVVVMAVTLCRQGEYVRAECKCMVYVRNEMQPNEVAAYNSKAYAKQLAASSADIRFKQGVVEEVARDMPKTAPAAISNAVFNVAVRVGSLDDRGCEIVIAAESRDRGLSENAVQKHVEALRCKVEKENRALMDVSLARLRNIRATAEKSRSDAMSVLRGASPDAAGGNKKALEELKESEATCNSLEVEEQRLRAEIEKQLIEFHVGVLHVKKRAEVAK